LWLFKTGGKMISVDFHSHSLFSGCGVHTIIELLQAAKERGMAGLAITDHGKFVGGNANSVFFERLLDPVSGIRFLKGIEANLDPLTGKTDVPIAFLQNLDIVLLGLHDNLPQAQSAEFYTNLLLSTLEKNPFIDVITHPNSLQYPLNFDRLIEAAIRLDVVIEMNNSKVMLKRSPTLEVERLILACKKRACRVALSSDAHCVHELGRDEDIRPLLAKHQFPEELIVNRTSASAFEFIAERKARRARLSAADFA